MKPERFDDASAIADHLNAKRTVVLNLESTNKDISRRLVDLFHGSQTAYVITQAAMRNPHSLGCHHRID